MKRIAYFITVGCPCQVARTNRNHLTFDGIAHSLYNGFT